MKRPKTLRAKRKPLSRLALESLEQRLVLDGAPFDVNVTDLSLRVDHAIELRTTSLLDDGEIVDDSKTAASPPVIEEADSADQLKEILIRQAVERWQHLFGERWLRHEPLVLSHQDPNADWLDRPILDQALSHALDVGRREYAAAVLQNVQVPGVADPDLVQTDGEYLFVVGPDKHITVVDVRDVVDTDDSSEMHVVARIAVEARPSEILLVEDRLIVVSRQHQISSDRMGFPDIDSLVASRPGRATVAVYDVADASRPGLLSTIELDGNLVDVRAADGLVSLVLSDDLHFPAPQPVCELAPDDSPGRSGHSHPNGTSNQRSGLGSRVGDWLDRILPPDRNDLRDRLPLPVCHFETVEEYTTRIGEGLLDRVLPDVRTTLPGGDTIHTWLVSPEDFAVDGDHGHQIVSVVLIDATGDEPGVTASTAMVTGFPMGVHSTGENVYVANLRGDGGAATHLYQFTIDSDDQSVEFSAAGAVAGRTLAMDERDGLLRVVTTQGWGRQATSHIFVLQPAGDQLDQAGAVNDVASGRMLLAAHFHAEIVYLVTLAPDDPLIAVDLSDLDNPVVGEVDVPGLTSFLRAFGDNYLIAIGRDVSLDQGIPRNPQIALFDVGDVSAPEVLDEYDVDFPGFSWAPLIHGGQAIQFYEDIGVLALPLRGRALPVPGSLGSLPDRLRESLGHLPDWLQDLVEDLGSADGVVQLPENWGDILDKLPDRLRDVLDDGLDGLPTDWLALVRELFGEGERAPVVEPQTGVWLFRIDPSADPATEAPIDLLGKIATDRAVERTERIGDVLFAISANTVTAYSLSEPGDALADVYIGRSAQNDVVTVASRGPTKIEVLANDRVPPEARIVAVSDPMHGGKVEIAESGRAVIYTPYNPNRESEINGMIVTTLIHFIPRPDSFEYTVDLGNGLEETATVQVRFEHERSGRQMAELARDDLARRLNVSPDSIEIKDVVSHRWGDSCLGVETGEPCLTVVTPGFKVWLRTQGNTYRYHTDTVAKVILAERREDPERNPVRPDSFRVRQGSSDNELDVLANDFPGMTFIVPPKITAVSAASGGGTVTISDDGLKLKYTPAEGFAGREKFTYTVDGRHRGEVTVFVVGEPERNGARPDFFRVKPNSEGNRLDVLKNDFPGQTFIKPPQITSVSETSSGGKVEIIEDGLLLRYTPASGFTGSEAFTYTVDNGATARVVVHVVLDQDPTKPPPDGNPARPLVEVDLKITDEAGNELERVEIGQTFYVEVWVDDLRVDGQGVFGAYLDLEFNSRTAQPAGDIEFSAGFENGRNGEITSTEIDEFGAFSNSIAPVGGEPQLLARIAFEASEAGEWLAAANPADNLPVHEITLYGMDEPVSLRQVKFDKLRLEVVSGLHNETEPTDVNFDKATTPLDALAIINRINIDGMGSIRETLRGYVQQLSSSANQARMYYDVNKDGYLTAQDPLVVINYVNARAREALRDVVGQVEGQVGSPGDALSAALERGRQLLNQQGSNPNVDLVIRRIREVLPNLPIANLPERLTRVAAEAVDRAREGVRDAAGELDEILEQISEDLRSGTTLDEVFAELGRV